MAEVVLPSCAPREAIAVVGFFRERLARLETFPGPDERNAADTWLPAELAPALEALMAEVERQAVKARALRKERFEARLPMTPGMISLARWAEERRPILEVLAEAPSPAGDANGTAALFKRFMDAAIEQVTRASGDIG